MKLYRRTRIKMCGMTRCEDVIAACQAGADAIGMIFYPPSPRNVTLDQAKLISESVSLMTDRVVLFVDPDPGYVREVLAETNADIIQFHGKETLDFCQQFDRRFIKALRVKQASDIIRELDAFQSADAILLDAYVKGVPGGTGKTFDWDIIPEHLASRVMLAGGLNPENVAQAIAQVRPFAVDVSGGLEQEPGKKDHNKIWAFSHAVRHADGAVNEISS